MIDDMNDIISSLVHFFSKSNEPWGIKDDKSSFIYANDRHHELVGVPTTFDFEGRYDEDIPSSMSQFAREFRQHDRKVEETRDRVTSLEVHPFENRDYLQPWFIEKYPLFDLSGNCRGTVWHGRPVENIILTRLNKIKIPTSLVFTPPSKVFSEREWEIVFYLLQTYTVKEIAKCLGLSQRTVGNYVQSMYQKIGVNNKRGLLEYCHDNNINNYIPQSFFKRCESMPLSDSKEV